MSYPNAWLPLFPLNAVLFPAGILPLKVFEARYIDMARDCIARQQPFGAIRIQSDNQASSVAEPGMVGCLAHIQESDMPEPGVLLLRIQGGERFSILETRATPDRRLEARIRMIASDIKSAVSAMHVSCATALKAVIDDINQKGRASQGERFISPFSQPLRLDESGWVANRWCEILPIPLIARQKLLELEDAQSRLAIVHRYLQQHKIL